MKVLIAYDGSASPKNALRVVAAVAARAACSVEAVRLRNGGL